jgi:hypothetical protein
LENNSEPTTSGNKTPDGEPPPPPTVREEHRVINPDSASRTRAYEQKHPLEWAIFILLIFTWIATSVAACYTRNQWITADDQERRSLRAYVGIDWAAVLINSPTQEQMTAWVRLKNYGTTPAYHVKSWLNFSKLPRDSILPFNQVGEAGNEAILWPSGTGNLSSSQSNATDQQQLIIDRKGSLFVWGHTDYIDAFNAPHFLDFKGRMDGPLDTIMSDGREAHGWGFNPVANGINGN